MQATIATVTTTSYDGGKMKPQNPIIEIREWTATLTESVSRVAIQILEHLPAAPGAVVRCCHGYFDGTGRPFRSRYRAAVKQT